MSAPGEGVPPPAPRPWRSLSQFIAFGFCSGLSPRAPGTAGTLVAVGIYLLLAHWPLWAYSVFVLLASLFGIWICGVASRELRQHDHPGIVWDEFAGFWLTMWAVPAEWVWIVAGFVVFRVFDILKPWPISVLDRRVGGGWGIMADDLLAGAMACMTLHIALWLV